MEKNLVISYNNFHIKKKNAYLVTNTNKERFRHTLINEFFLYDMTKKNIIYFFACSQTFYLCLCPNFSYYYNIDDRIKYEC